MITEKDYVLLVITALSSKDGIDMWTYNNIVQTLSKEKKYQPLIDDIYKEGSNYKLKMEYATATKIFVFEAAYIIH